MITVHHLENSRSHRIVWMLEELGLDYRIEIHRRHPETSMAPPELRRLHPLGKAPLLADGERVLAESGAILEHLVEQYGRGQFAPKPGTPERTRYQYWMHAAEGTVMPLLVMKLMFARVQERAPFFVRPVARAIVGRVESGYLGPNLRAVLTLMESTLEGSAWFAGDTFSAADVQMGYPAEAAEARGGLDVRYPRLQAFLQTIRQRPAYQRAVEKGGPLSLLTR